MYCLDIVGVIIPPRPTHSLWISVVWHDVAIVSELFVADRADTSLSSDLSIQQLSHFGR
jgi:hypothetical protein